MPAVEFRPYAHHRVSSKPAHVATWSTYGLLHPPTHFGSQCENQANNPANGQHKYHYSFISFSCISLTQPSCVHVAMSVPSFDQTL